MSRSLHGVSLSATLYDIEADSSSIRLIFLKPVESSSEVTFISRLFDNVKEMFPATPLPGGEDIPIEVKGEYCTKDTLPSASVF